MEKLMYLPLHKNPVGKMRQNECDGNHSTILPPYILSPFEEQENYNYSLRQAKWTLKSNRVNSQQNQNGENTLTMWLQSNHLQSSLHRQLSSRIKYPTMWITLQEKIWFLHITTSTIGLEHSMHQPKWSSISLSTTILYLASNWGTLTTIISKKMLFIYQFQTKSNSQWPKTDMDPNHPVREKQNWIIDGINTHSSGLGVGCLQAGIDMGLDDQVERLSWGRPTGLSKGGQKAEWKEVNYWLNTIGTRSWTSDNIKWE